MIQSAGDPNATYFICGEAPGAQELQQGKPFVGPTGRILWNCGARYGISPATSFVTNVVQSAPTLKTGKPSAGQIREEWQRLDDELRSSRARVLIAIGDIATRRITGIQQGITTMRGYCIDPLECEPSERKVLTPIGTYKTNSKHGKKGDPKYAYKLQWVDPVLPPTLEWIIPVLHPAGIMRSGFAQIPALRADLRRAARAANGALQLIDQVEYEDTPTLPPAGATVAIDIETDGGDDERSWNITQVGMAWNGGCWSSTWSAATAAAVVHVFTQARTVVMHNAMYDTPRLERATGVRCAAQIFDTMIGAMVLCPELPKGLEKVAPLYLDVTRWKHQKDAKQYNAKDVYITKKLYTEETVALGPQLEAVQTICQGLRPLWRAQEGGIPIDPVAMEAFLEEKRATINGALEEWPYLDVDIGSPYQLANLLYKRLQLPRQYGKEGKSTTEEAALRILRTGLGDGSEAANAIDLVLEFRHATNELKEWARASEFGNGTRIYPQMMAADKEEATEKEKGRRGSAGQGSATARIQIRKPPANQLNRAGRYIILPFPDESLFYPDWSQAEARIEAERFDDDVLRQALADGLHDANAKILGVDKVRAKNFWFGKGRFAGVPTLTKTMRSKGFKVTQAEMREWSNAVDAKYKKWARGRLALVEEARAQGYVENPFGLRRRFYDKGQAPAIVGWYPQSTVSMMLWTILAQWDDWRLLLPMHDAVLCSTYDKRHIDEVCALMSMEFPQIAKGWHCPVDVKIGNKNESWGAMEDRIAKEKKNAGNATAVADS